MENNNNLKFEVILAIVNNGFADSAMLVAREAGAKGGTIIRGRGSSNIGVDKKYGLTITPEKELLMILCPVEDRDRIMDAVYQNSIKENDTKIVIFSLPVESTVGLKYEKYDNVNK